MTKPWFVERYVTIKGVPGWHLLIIHRGWFEGWPRKEPGAR